MKILICGAGRATLSLLARMGEGWNVTIVDSRASLDAMMREYESVTRVVTGDASSPVVLERAGLEDHDWVVAFTPDDEVNLAVVRFAAEAGVNHIVGRAVDQEVRAVMREAGARTFSEIAALSRDVLQFLRNPRVRVVPVASGQGEVIEVEVGPRSGMTGLRPADLEGEPWRLCGVFRDGKLRDPDEDVAFREGDVLVILGPPDQFQPVCTLLECGETDFPRAYGSAVLLSLHGGDEDRDRALMHECMNIVQATMTEHLVLLGGERNEAVRESASLWSESVEIDLQPLSDDPYRQVESICGEQSVGLAVVPWRERSFIASLRRRTPLRLAHALPCPLLVARGRKEYRRILVPFNGQGNSGLALEIALQLGGRLGAEIAVAVVQEADFMHQEDERENWGEQALEHARELARGRGMAVEEIVREGNPVREIVGMTGEFDLLVVASSEREGLSVLSPDVGEHLLQKAECSVLVVTG